MFKVGEIKVRLSLKLYLLSIWDGLNILFVFIPVISYKDDSE